MAKFNQPTVRPRPPTGPTKTTTAAPTHEGGAGFYQDAKTELFNLAVSNMVSESTFYEPGRGRDERFARLVHDNTLSDPVWTAGLIGWLRGTVGMRTASMVAACEYIDAISGARPGGWPMDAAEVGNVPSGADVILSSCQRPDEPGEALAYWWTVKGRKLPNQLKAGLAAAALKLYTQRSTLKYDTPTHAVRFGDVIDLTHPTPETDGQSALFRHLVDRRHGRGYDDRGAETLAKLGVLSRAHLLDSVAPEDRRDMLAHPTFLADAGYTWERLSGWLPGGMDAAAWEAIIPSMGYMALLRNLRNFEQAKVSFTVLHQVAERLVDPEQVAKSRQFPFRFYSAYLHGGGVFFASALERAMGLSVGNIPELPGRTGVFIDVSGSMTWGNISERSKVTYAQAAALFGAAVADRNNGAQLFAYDTSYRKVKPSVSVLRTIENIGTFGGGGTNTWPCVLDAAGKHGPFDRVLVFTDGQDHPSRLDAQSGRLAGVPVYVWNLAGYKTVNVDTNRPGRYLFGGFTDAAFRIVSLLEQGTAGLWPWEF